MLDNSHWSELAIKKLAMTGVAYSGCMLPEEAHQYIIDLQWPHAYCEDATGAQQAACEECPKA